MAAFTLQQQSQVVYPIASKTKNLYSLPFYRKSLPTPGVDSWSDNLRINSSSRNEITYYWCSKSWKDLFYTQYQKKSTKPITSALDTLILRSLLSITSTLPWTSESDTYSLHTILYLGLAISGKAIENKLFLLYFKRKVHTECSATINGNSACLVKWSRSH